MKWNPKESHRDGDTRVVKYFAVFPVRLGDGGRIWLEWYYEMKTWSSIWMRWNEGTPINRYQLK